jgi:hypothetical protein
MRQLTLAAIALLTGASSSLAQGHMGTSAGATVHARRTATLPEAVGRRQRGSAMFAAKPHEAEQELPEGIPEPRNVEAASGGNRRSTSPTTRYPSRQQAPWRSSEVRPDAGAALAAGGADETGSMSNSRT